MSLKHNVSCSNNLLNIETDILKTINKPMVLFDNCVFVSVKCRIKPFIGSGRSFFIYNISVPYLCICNISFDHFPDNDVHYEKSSKRNMHTPFVIFKSLRVIYGLKSVAQCYIVYCTINKTIIL